MTKDKLYAFGDSFTDKQYRSGETPWIECDFPRWPEVLADNLGLEDRNFGVSGSSNERIFVTAIDEIIENHEEIDTVCILWTNIWRFYVYGWNFNPGTNLQNTNFKGKTEAEIRKLKHLWNEDNLYYDVVNALYNWHMADHRDAHKLTLMRFLKNIKTLQKLCKDFNINYYQWSGFDMLYTGRAGSNTVSPYHNNFFRRGRFVDLAYKYQELIDFSDMQNPDNTIGWPWVEALGGITFDDYIRNKNIHSEHVISLQDSHPNEKGHRLIAEFFIKEINK